MPALTQSHTEVCNWVCIGKKTGRWPGPWHPLTGHLFLSWNPDMAYKTVVRPCAAKVLRFLRFFKVLSLKNFRSYVQDKTCNWMHRSSHNPQTAFLEMVVIYEIVLNSEQLSSTWDTQYKTGIMVIYLQHVIHRYLPLDLDLYASSKNK